MPGQCGRCSQSHIGCVVVREQTTSVTRNFMELLRDAFVQKQSAQYLVAAERHRFSFNVTLLLELYFGRLDEYPGSALAVSLCLRGVG